MSITKNLVRSGNFTSSENYRLMTFAKDKISPGAPAFEYIQECNMERKLGRSLSSEVSTHATSWGNLVERMAYEKLPFNYNLTSQDTIVHPKYDFWVGSPDGHTEDAIFDIKCPTSLKSFCQLVNDDSIELVRNNHKDGDKFYWQIVSNAILKDKEYGELIVYVPYQEDLNLIREMASNYDGDQNKIAWINWAQDEDLPYLVKGGYYNDLNIIRFKIPDEDKEFMTSRIVELSKYLIPWPETKLI